MSSLLFGEKTYQVLSKKPFKPFYNLLVPRPARKQMHFFYHEIPTQHKVATYWDKVIDDYLNHRLELQQMTAQKPELVGKKIIWQYWGQGFDDLPEVVQLSFLSVDKFKQDFQVIRLTDNNIAEYLNFPNFVYQKRQDGIFRPVFFSDLLRVALMKCYGGAWLDATVILTKPLDERYFQSDFFVFSRDNSSPYQSLAEHNQHCYFNWQPEFKVNFLSSIVFGKANNEIATVLLDLLLYFWQTETQIPHYFFFQILINQIKQNQVVTFDFEVIDDVLPHLLQGVMHQVVDEQKFDDILVKIGLHKLTLHTKLQEKKGNNFTYYGFLKQFVEKYPSL